MVGKTYVYQESQSTIKVLESDEDFINSNTILLYYSLPDEIQTIDLINKYKNKKRILLPSVNGNELSLHEYSIYSKLSLGKYGIMESCELEFVNYSEIDLAVIPGIAFDKSFNRLGRGKGYYDRLLPKLNCKIIGICFDFQFIDHIPAEYHDFKMNKIIHGTTIYNNT